MNRVESNDFIAEIPIDTCDTMDLPNSLPRTENTAKKGKNSIVRRDDALDLPNSLQGTDIKT